MKVYMEHVNLSVNNLPEAVRFFETAFPEFEVRGGGERENNTRWLHIGTQETYIALTEAPNDNQHEKDYDKNGFNHVGFVVEDVAGIADRLLEAGFQRSYPLQEQRYRIRDYFMDAEGNEYEFVQYLSDKTEERNSYSD